MDEQKVNAIACIAHEANRGYQFIHPTPGIPVAPHWSEFPEDQREGVRSGVRLALEGATPEELHSNWVTEKYEAGWRYGEVKDAEAQTHPCLVPYDELPEEQRVKDRLFHAIVGAFA